jgi:hypothetical protein
MQINFDRLLHTPTGRIFISIMLGLGLASLFRRVCKDKNCIIFDGPVINQVDGKVFKHKNKCYTYDAETTNCDKTKKIIDIGFSNNPDEPLKNLFGF